MKIRHIPFRRDMQEAVDQGRKTQTRRPVTFRNSLTGGLNVRIWSELDFSQAWADPGPSPAGNPGPYLHVPRPCEETVHRVYPKMQPGDRFVVLDKTYEITAVRVERVQDISEEDAKAEGIDPEFEIDVATFVHNKKWDAETESTFYLGFKHMWDSIYGKTFPWASNCWCWVLEFKRIEP